MDDSSRTEMFKMGDMLFEYDIEKNAANIRKHGISFKTAARVFFDYDRIEMFDEENSIEEERYDTIGNIFAGSGEYTIGKVDSANKDILFVVYTERSFVVMNDNEQDVIRIISARFATSFERGLYYGKY